ncbi:hypothetical protein KJ636_02965 [Patescibacteria group bacterium]|nr:hypothetical protein [Patescibacteria group bacterium]
MKFQIDKKSLLYLGIVIFVALLSLLLIWRFSQMPESKKEIPQLTLPPKEEKIEQVLERLTPKETKPVTEQEKKEQEKLLEQLTPAKPKPMTEKEQKELEELLKKLTP